MRPSGTSSFDDDDDGVPGSLPNARVEPVDAPAREKPITAQRAGSMARTTKVYPQQEGTVFPRELLEFAIDAAREGYVRTANMGAAFNMMKRRLKDRWTVEKGPSGYVFKEHIHPLESYLRPGARHESTHKAPPPTPREKPAAPESEAVADARKRWDAAKTSGDAGAMTRTANDLLRAVEADRAERGETAPAQTEGGRHPTSEILAPEAPQNGGEPAGAAIASAAGDAIAKAADAAIADVFAPPVEDSKHGVGHAGADTDEGGTTAATIEDWLDKAGLYPIDLDRDDLSSGLTGELADEHLRRATDVITGRPFEERNGILRAFQERFGDENASRLAEHLKSISETSARFASDTAIRASLHEVRDDDPPGVANLQYQRPRASDEYPEQPGVGMDRVNRAERRDGWRRIRKPGQRHWVDPALGWDKANASETLAAAAGKPLTVEALLVWSHEVYMEERGDLLPSKRLPPGWEKVDEINDEESGYYAIAVRDKLTGTVVIINRGTTLTDKGDRVASLDIHAGRDTRQLVLAREFLVRVYEINKRTGKSGKIVVTGHSLGSACAQVQLAAAHYDKRLRGRLTDISGVGFSSLGAKDTIAAIQRTDTNWRDTDAGGLEPFAGDRFVNYTRRGDGIVVDRDKKRGKRESLGDTIWLDAIDERGLAADEASLRREPSWWGDESTEAAQGGTSIRIQRRYFDNHSLRSMYHPDFLDPLDRVFERRRSRRSQGVQ